jgi:hypothetical protein
VGDPSRALRRLQRVLEEQAKDAGLRCQPIYASEAYMGNALRRLTKAARAVVSVALQTER